MGWQLSSTTVVFLASFHSRKYTEGVAAHRNAEIEIESSARGDPVLLINDDVCGFHPAGRYFTRPFLGRMPLCTEKQARAAAYILTRNVRIQYSPQFERVSPRRIQVHASVCLRISCLLDLTMGRLK